MRPQLDRAMMIRSVHFALRSLMTLAVVLVAWMSAERAESKDVPGGKVTYSKHIAAILWKNCAACHRPGEVGPFSLLSYKDASKRADFIAEITTDRRMPPWRAEPNFGKFRDERRLSDREIELIAKWAEDGAPEGDAKDLPKPPSFPEGWQLGEPDMLLKMSEPFPVPAGGRDIYRCFVIPIPIETNKMVSAVEFRPGNAKVVHHAIMFLDANGSARKRDGADGSPGFTSFGGPGIRPTGGLGGWTPGTVPRFLPEGLVKYVQKGSDLVLQVHYHPNGKEESDQSVIGVHFSKKPVSKIVTGIAVMQTGLKIPAGDAHCEITAQSQPLPVNVNVLGLSPHMHNLGREFKATAKMPGGAGEIPLIWIKDWDFNWQGAYQFEKPIRLPKGAIINVSSIYDNSAANPKNPHNPPKAIHWGEQTTDEMCLCGVQVFADKSSDLKQIAEMRGNELGAGLDGGIPGQAEEVKKKITGKRTVDKKKAAKQETAKRLAGKWEAKQQFAEQKVAARAAKTQSTAKQPAQAEPESAEADESDEEMTELAEAEPAVKRTAKTPAAKKETAKRTAAKPPADEDDDPQPAAAPKETKKSAKTAPAAKGIAKKEAFPADGYPIPEKFKLLFTQFDTDHDGKISRAEFDKMPDVWKTQLRNGMLKYVDENGIGGAINKLAKPPAAKKDAAKTPAVEPQEEADEEPARPTTRKLAAKKEPAKRKVAEPVADADDQPPEEMEEEPAKPAARKPAAKKEPAKRQVAEPVADADDEPQEEAELKPARPVRKSEPAAKATAKKEVQFPAAGFKIPDQAKLMLSQFDKDGDGKLSRDEFDKLPDALKVGIRKEMMRQLDGLGVGARAPATKKKPVEPETAEAMPDEEDEPEPVKKPARPAVKPPASKKAAAKTEPAQPPADEDDEPPEVAAKKEAKPPAKTEAAAKPAEKKEPPFPAEGWAIPEKLKLMVSQFDKNGDGKLSKDEFSKMNPGLQDLVRRSFMPR